MVSLDIRSSPGPHFKDPLNRASKTIEVIVDKSLVFEVVLSEDADESEDVINLSEVKDRGVVQTNDGGRFVIKRLPSSIVAQAVNTTEEIRKSSKCLYYSRLKILK